MVLLWPLSYVNSSVILLDPKVEEETVASIVESSKEIIFGLMR